MTRFAYIADSHNGADPMGYQQQKGYPQLLPDILDALVDHLRSIGGVDFILHGGDMVDYTNNETIQSGAGLFELPFPVHLCLGNHDLTTRDAADTWVRLAPQFFGNGTPSYTIERDDCMIHVAPNHWDDDAFFWEEAQRPHLRAEQVEFLTNALDRKPELPHVIATHNSVFGLPVEQTGMSEPFHVPPAEFTDQITGLVSRYPNVACVLGAHNHLNMCVEQDSVDYVTASSLVEAPFEFKLFELTPTEMAMSTISLADSLDVDVKYDSDKAFVQGRPVDREFSRDL